MLTKHVIIKCTGFSIGYTHSLSRFDDKYGGEITKKKNKEMKLKLYDFQIQIMMILLCSLIKY